MALDTLWQHKLRSFLTILGVVVGTMTVIIIAAFVSGIEARVSQEIDSSIYAYKFDPGFNINPTAEERMRKPLSYEDPLAVQAECPLLTLVAPFMSPVDFTGGPFTERVNVRTSYCI